jgi:DNA-binding transcriptional LysR family regulator
MTIERMRDIHAFVHVAEAKSFTAAAERIGLSRSAVGKSVLRLEDRLGVRLLQRTTRSVSLTGEGAVFLERCIRILADLDEAEMSMLSHSQTPRGRLRLELPVSFGRLHVLPIVNQFMSKWPEISVNISFNDRFVDLIDEGIDLAIRLGGSDDSRLMTRLLAPHRLVTCASPTYLKSHGVPASIRNSRATAVLFTVDAQSIGVSASTATFAPWPSTAVSVQRTQLRDATQLMHRETAT